MKIVRNEKGLALVMVLVLAAISLALMSALIYMITSGTQVSGLQKRYKTALEAGIGGAEVTYQMLAARGDPGLGLAGFTITALNVGGTNCLTEKLNKPTSAWLAACNNTLTIDPNVQATYDMTFQLGTGPTYTIYAKIADTVEGNSGGDEGLIKSGVVAANSGEVTVQSKPYLYIIEMDAENAANRDERAKLSILYQY